MKDYEIISEDEETKKEIEEIIEKINLTENIFVIHKAEPGTCGLEVHYKIDKGYTRENLAPRGTLRIYVNEPNPWIVLSRNTNINFASFNADPDNNLKASIGLEDVLIEVLDKIEG